jgi:8-oxo-dGTP pyrophosphatase MutT (NUDIX family)
MQPLDKNSLRKRLGEPLPGISAQMKMMPRLDDTSRFDITNKDKAIPGGVLILIYPHEGELYLPLMLRPEYGGAHSGQVSFPGGRKEPEDIDLLNTALRESNEELGIPEDKVEILGQLTELFIIASNFSVLPVIGYMDHRPNFLPDPREVVEIIEAPISLLLKDQTVKEKPFKVGAGFHIDAPYFDIHGHHVWGATAMMMSEFLTVFKDL